MDTTKRFLLESSDDLKKLGGPRTAMLVIVLFAGLFVFVPFVFVKPK
jgi:hypothetical protein